MVSRSPEEPQCFPWGSLAENERQCSWRIYSWRWENRQAQAAGRASVSLAVKAGASHSGALLLGLGKTLRWAFWFCKGEANTLSWKEEGCAYRSRLVGVTTHRAPAPHWVELRRQECESSSFLTTPQVCTTHVCACGTERSAMKQH